MSKKGKATSKRVEDYWFDHYVVDDHCGLCGNSGVIDSTGVRTPAGLEVGGKFLCICPNGQSLRKHGADPVKVLSFVRRSS